MGLFSRKPQDRPEVYPEPVQAAPTDPRRQTSGTSYQAQGSMAAPPEVYKETGSAIAPSAFGSGPPELATRTARLRTYSEMVDDDSSAQLALKAVETPVLGADFFIEPYSDNQEDIDIREFVEYNLFRFLNTPFLSVIEHALTMCKNGVALAEIVYEEGEWAPKRTGGNRRRYTMIRKIAPRPVANVKEFLYDDAGGPAGVKYNRIDSNSKVTEVEIPIHKLIIFTFGKVGSNLEGRSVLRSAYKHWWYKNVLYRIDGIQKERHGTGVPEIELPPGYTAKDVNEAWRLVTNLRTNERAGIVKPPGWIVGFAKMETQPVNIMESIEHHDAHILFSVLAQFLILGQKGTGGSRAVAGSGQDMFQKSMRYLVNLICDYFNLYVIPALVSYNFDTKNYPTIQARNIGESKELQMWASAIANLIARNAITVDYEFEQWVRQVIDGPKKQGGKQTPENNPGGATSTSKGDVNTEDDQSGNIGKGADES